MGAWAIPSVTGCEKPDCVELGKGRCAMSRELLECWDELRDVAGTAMNWVTDDGKFMEAEAAATKADALRPELEALCAERCFTCDGSGEIQEEEIAPGTGSLS